MTLHILPGPAQSPQGGPEPPSLRDPERLRRYREYLDFYNGKHWDGQAGSRQRTRLTLNYARAIVDKGATYLMGRGVNFAVEGWRLKVGMGGNSNLQPSTSNPELAQQAERLLYQVYQDNDLAAADLHGALNAGVLGDAVFKVFWDQAEQRIRVVNLDPFHFFARPAGDDLRTLRQVELRYHLPADEVRGSRFQVPGRSNSNLEPRTSNLADVVEQWTPQTFSLWIDGRVVRHGANPYGFIPFVHVPNLQPPNELWGLSDLRDLIGLNRELNARMSDQADIIRHYANPPVVFRGVNEHSDLAVGPGTVWDLPADADVKLLEWHGAPAAVQEHIERVFRALWEVSETPRTAFGDSGKLLSGVALEVELRPIIQKTLRRRIFWEAAIRRRSLMILHLAAQHGLLAVESRESRVESSKSRVGPLEPSLDSRLATLDSRLSIRVLWPSLIPSDDAAEVRNNIALVRAGLRSARTAMDLLGVPDPEAELERVREDGWRLEVEGWKGESNLQPSTSNPNLHTSNLEPRTSNPAEPS